MLHPIYIKHKFRPSVRPSVADLLTRVPAKRLDRFGPNLARCIVLRSISSTRTFSENGLTDKHNPFWKIQTASAFCPKFGQAYRANE